MGSNPVWGTKFNNYFLNNHGDINMAEQEAVKEPTIVEALNEPDVLPMNVFPFRNIEFFKKYTLKVPKGQITPEGEQLIKEYLYKCGVRMKWHQEYSVEWVYMTKRGTLAKRIRAMLKRGKHNPDFPMEDIPVFNLSDAQTAKIGEIAFDNTYKDTEYTFDFDNKIEWRAGAFADPNSCLLLDKRSISVPTMLHAGIFAMRFFNKNGAGVGRAWILPRQDMQGYLVMNGYGLSTSTIALLFSTWLGCKYSILRVHTTGNGKEYFYTNGESTSFLCAPPEQFDKLPSILDLPITLYYGKNKHQCYKCNGIYDKRSLHKVINSERVDGEQVLCCKRCYDYYSKMCVICENVFLRDWAQQVFRDGGSAWCCGNCLNANFVVTTCCSRWYHKSNIVTEDLPEQVKDKQICEDCFRYYYTCYLCENLFNGREGDGKTTYSLLENKGKTVSVCYVCHEAYTKMALFLHSNNIPLSEFRKHLAVLHNKYKLQALSNKLYDPNYGTYYIGENK